VPLIAHPVLETISSVGCAADDNNNPFNGGIMKTYSFLSLSLVAALSACASSDSEPKPKQTMNNPAGTKDTDKTPEPSKTPEPDKTPDLTCTTESSPEGTLAAVEAVVEAWNLKDAEAQACEVKRLWAEDGRLVSAARKTQGSEDNSEHFKALANGSFRLTSGVTAHHGGTRFSWATDEDEGMALALLDDKFRFTDFILFSGAAAKHEDVAAYDPYLAAWNRESPDERRQELEEVWPEQARYVDPTADVKGQDALLAVIDAYVHGFDGRAIVIDEVGQKTNGWFWVTWTIRDLANENDLALGMDFCQLDEKEENLLYLFSFFGDMPAAGVGGNEGDCLPCFPAKMSGAPPSELCTSGSPPSTQISNELGACVCSTACPSECGDSLCTGMAPSAACFECIESHGHLLEACPSEIDACWADG